MQRYARIAVFYLDVPSWFFAKAIVILLGLLRAGHHEYYW